MRSESTITVTRPVERFTGAAGATVPAPGLRVGHRPNLEFAGLLAVLLLWNAPYLISTFLPYHDTLRTFFLFHFFYSEWFFQSDLAQWVPYGAYGLPATYEQFVSLSPISYLVAVVGSLARVRDALWLFKWSMVLEQVVFLAGLYRLSRRLFERPSTRILVCLAGVGTTVWYAQIFFNFRMFSLFPWVADCVLAFVADRRPARLWLAGLVGLAWLLGNPPYFAAVWLFVWGILGALWLWPVRSRWRALCSLSWKNLLPLGLFLGLTLAYLACLQQAMAFTVFTASDRDALTGRANLATFLTYIYNLVPGDFSNLVFGSPTHVPSGTRHDSNVYLGLLTLCFFAWSVLRVRTRAYGALVIAMAALALLQLGHFFATLVYYAFPLIGYYRHRGLLFGFTKILLVFCAGFGWEAFWSARARLRSMLVALLIMGAVVDSQSMTQPYTLKMALRCLHWNPWEILSGPCEVGWTMFLWRLTVYAALLGIGVLAVWQVRRRSIRLNRQSTPAQRTLPVRIALLLGLLADMGSYRLLVRSEAPPLPAERVSSLEAATVASPQFQDRRTTEPPSGRSRQALQLAEPKPNYPWGQATYVWTYSFAQFDPCVSTFRKDWQLSHVAELLKVAQSETEVAPAFKAVLGCESPKLRLIPQAVYTETADEAARLLQAAPHTTSDRVIIEAPTLSVPPEAASSGRGQDAGTLKVTGFSANALTVEVDVTAPTGAWLVYADAWHPGWRATVNGRRVPVAKANLAFKAVRLERGAATVRFVFRPAGWWLSHVIAVFGLIAGLALAGLSIRLLIRKKTAGPREA